MIFLFLNNLEFRIRIRTNVKNHSCFFFLIASILNELLRLQNLVNIKLSELEEEEKKKMNCLFGKKLKNESKIPFLMKLIFLELQIEQELLEEDQKFDEGYHFAFEKETCDEI